MDDDAINLTGAEEEGDWTSREVLLGFANVWGSMDWCAGADASQTLHEFVVRYLEMSAAASA